MKRILLLLMALSMNLGAYAANTYTAVITSDVSVTDLSSGSSYRYLLEFNQLGNNQYKSNVYLVLTPKSKSFTGTFSIAAGTIDDYESYVQYNGAYRYLIDYNAEKYTEITIKDAGDGTYTMEGWLRSKNGNNYYYYSYAAADNVFKVVTPDPYKDEPSEKTSITCRLSNLKPETAGAAPVSLYACAEDWSEDVTLLFNVPSYDIPAGEYPINDSGLAGTVMASDGRMTGYYYNPSYYSVMDASYNTIPYFLTGGAVTVAYEGDIMTVKGVAATAHGSSLTLDLSGTNPFKKVENILSVSSVSAVFSDDKSYFGLSIEAKNGDKTCNGYVRINSSDLVGEYDYRDFGQWSYFGSTGNYIEGSDLANSASIAATGNPDEYRLDLRISLQDNQTYIIDDAVFKFIPPAPESPFDAEPAPSKFTKTFPSTPYVYDEGASKGIVTLEFHNGELDTVVLPFVVTSPSGIMPGRYVINDSGHAGTIASSTGRQTIEGALTDTPCLYTRSIGLSDYAPYYVTGGWLDVSYRNARTIYISGLLTTAKGSEITVEMEGRCAGICARPLPENVMQGVLSGTDATYMFAYDVTADASGHVIVSATACTDGQADGFEPKIRFEGRTTGMNYDSVTGRCSFKTTDTFSKGTSVSFDVILDCSAGSTEGRTIRYVVE